MSKGHTHLLGEAQCEHEYQRALDSSPKCLHLVIAGS